MIDLIVFAEEDENDGWLLLGKSREVKGFCLQIFLAGRMDSPAYVTIAPLHLFTDADPVLGTG